MRKTKSTNTVKPARSTTDTKTTAVEPLSSALLGHAHLRNSVFVSPTKREKRVRCPLDHKNPKTTRMTAAQTKIAVLLNVLSLSSYRGGGGGGLRTPLGRKPKALFKTAAFNRSATPPSCSEIGRTRGTRTPDRRFWRPMLYQLSYRPKSPRTLQKIHRSRDKNAEGHDPPRSMFNSD
jgi:hypothetical protein